MRVVPLHFMCTRTSTPQCKDSVSYVLTMNYTHLLALPPGTPASFLPLHVTLLLGKFLRGTARHSRLGHWYHPRLLHHHMQCLVSKVLSMFIYKLQHIPCCWWLVAQSCPTLCDPMDCSTPGFPVLHHLLELAQTHIHWVGDGIQSSCLLSSPSPPAFSLSQHQGLF